MIADHSMNDVPMATKVPPPVKDTSPADACEKKGEGGGSRRSKTTVRRKERRGVEGEERRGSLACLLDINPQRMDKPSILPFSSSSSSSS